MTSFAEEMAASMPEGLVLPEAFRLVFEWMDANGHVERIASDPYGWFTPIGSPSGCHFHTASLGWPLGADGKPCIAVIMQTGRDGSQAAIWRDDEGRQRFVHIGSGSGSTLAGVLTDDPLDMLKLFAIGYQDVCWPEDHALTPAQVEERGRAVSPRRSAPTARSWRRPST